MGTPSYEHALLPITFFCNLSSLMPLWWDGEEVCLKNLINWSRWMQLEKDGLVIARRWLNWALRYAQQQLLRQKSWWSTEKSRDRDVGGVCLNRARLDIPKCLSNTDAFLIHRALMGYYHVLHLLVLSVIKKELKVGSYGLSNIFYFMAHLHGPPGLLHSGSWTQHYIIQVHVCSLCLGPPKYLSHVG